MEETATESDLGPNKRLQVSKGFRNEQRNDSALTQIIDISDEPAK